MTQIRNIGGSMACLSIERKFSSKGVNSKANDNNQNFKQDWQKRQSQSSTTIDSPLGSPGKEIIEDNISISQFQEDETCWNFMNKGYCEKGTKCSQQHTSQITSSCGQINTALLQNFPEMILHRPFKRLQSFLL